MIKAIQLTAADANAHNLYALILAAQSVSQLPQRVDLGVVTFPDTVATITFLLPITVAGNSGESLSVQDLDGNEIGQVITGIPLTLNSGSAVNNLSVQEIKIKASASGVVTDVSVIVN